MSDEQTRALVTRELETPDHIGGERETFACFYARSFEFTIL